MTSWTGMSRQRGFTLLEIMVALAIFAVIAMAGAEIFAGVAGASERSQAKLKDLQRIQRAMTIIERDILQIVARAPRIEGENNDIVFTGGRYINDSSADGMAFVRAGWLNPQQRLARSQLQAVSYILNADQQLVRQYSLFVDQATGSEAKQQVLLEQVSDLQLYFLTQPIKNNQPKWAESFTGSTLPLAIAIELETQQFGLIRRELALFDADYQAPDEDQQSTEGKP